MILHVPGTILIACWPHFTIKSSDDEAFILSLHHDINPDFSVFVKLITLGSCVAVISLVGEVEYFLAGLPRSHAEL